MPRKTQQNNITNPELLSQINKENKQLTIEFLDYLRSTQRSETTIASYKNDLDIAFVWGLLYNENKPFIEWTKRNIVAFQNWLINVNKNSPARVRRLRATLSSLSNFIERILDEDYPDFRNIINMVEAPAANATREKTVFTDEELDRLLSYLTERKQYKKACMLALAICSGRRKAELVLFKTSFFAEENIIFGSLYKTPERIKTKGQGGGNYIYCYVLAKKFKPYLDLWLEEREQAGIESKWLFPHEQDPTQHMDSNTLNSWANTFSRIVGKDFYWHSLRHYMTTYLSRSGIPDSVIADIISWKSVDMVNIYKDISVDEGLAKYFGEEGIIRRESEGLSSL